MTQLLSWQSAQAIDPTMPLPPVPSYPPSHEPDLQLPLPQEIITDSGKVSTNPITVTGSYNEGEIIVDSRGIQWIVTEVDRYKGLPFYWLEQFTESPGAFSIPELPDISKIKMPQILPDIDRLLPEDWNQRVMDTNRIPDLTQFDFTKYSDGLHQSMGSEEYATWSSQVSQFIDESAGIASQISQDGSSPSGESPKNNSPKVPFPQLAPVIDRSIEPLREEYIRTIDETLDKAIQQLGAVNAHLIAFTLTKTAELGTKSNWDCTDCDSISKPINFAEEASRAEDQADGIEKTIASPYAPGVPIDPQLLHYKFQMPLGPERADLEHTYIKLIDASPVNPQGRTAKVIGLNAVAKADEAFVSQDGEGFSHFKEIALAMADIAIGFTPVGIAKDTYEAISGHSMLDGHELSAVDRGAAAFGAVVGLGTLGVGAGAVKTAIKAFNRLHGLAQNTRHGAQALAALTHAFTTMAEIGIKTKSEFKQLFEFAKRTLGNETGAFGDLHRLTRIKTMFQDFASKGLRPTAVIDLIQRTSENGLDFLNRFIRANPKANAETLESVADSYVKLEQKIVNVPVSSFEGTVHRAVLEADLNIRGPKNGLTEAEEIEKVFAWHSGMKKANGRYSIGGELGQEALYTSIGKKEDAWVTVVEELGADADLPLRLASKEVKLEKVLDLTDPEVRKMLNVDYNDIVDKYEYDLTHQLGDLAKKHGFDGIKAPSAANAENGGVNLIILKRDL